MTDRFEQDGIVLMLGDCRDLLPIEADAVVVDPPFGIGFAAQPTKWQRLAGQEPEAWDDSTIADLPNLIQPYPLQIVWGGNYYHLPISRGWLSWFKPDAPPSMGSLELAWTNQDQNIRQLSWSISATNAERAGHPTQKPIRVMQWCMDQTGIATDATVLDFCMGSGTTAIACIRTGRKFIGIEKDPAYFQIAVDRVKRELAQPMLIPFAEPKLKTPELAFAL